MTVIGITGGSGAGKTTAMAVLAGLGSHSIDCDLVYHELLEVGGPMLEELVQRFPGVVADGRLERKALGQIVFHDPKALEDLSVITHSYVCREVDERLRALRGSGQGLVSIEAIALIESGLSQRCDLVVAVLAPVEDRVRRITAREGISPDYARARIESQKSDAFFRAHCDQILKNPCSSREEFAEECRAFFERLLMARREE